MRILWDLDGTLFDTYPKFTDMFHELLDGKADKPEILAHLKISFTHSYDFFGLSKLLVQERLRLSPILPEQTPPFPGVEEVLARADLNVIMTHKDRRHVLELLDYYGWSDYFAEIVAGDDGYPSKPDPASYRYLHDKYRLDLAIGDREIDILPGRAVGMHTCLFQNETPGADFYLAHYADFFEKVGRRLKVES